MPKNLKRKQSEVGRIVAEMQRSPNLKGAELDRRSKLIELLEHVGFPRPLNDVTQGRLRPDLRFFPTGIAPSNAAPCSLIVETKDLGDLPTFESLPFRQMLTYVHQNRHRLVAIAATDYERWYYFEFDIKGPAYDAVIAIAQAAAGTDKRWQLAGAESRARKALEPFWRSPALNFSEFGTKHSQSFLASVRSVLSPSVLDRASIFSDSKPEVTAAEPIEGIARALSELMYPIVESAKVEMKRAKPGTKAYSRFKLWLKQRRIVEEDVDAFLEKDRNPSEEQVLEQASDEFAWLSSYSILNLLYFLKGLEERHLVAAVFNSPSTLKEPKAIFGEMWNWIDSGKAGFATDFIRLQRVYCDWLIPKVAPAQLNEVVRYFGRIALLQLGKSDLLGRLYEQLMQNLEPASRKRLGQYYTPRPIAETLWRLAWQTLKTAKVPPEEVTTVDPAAGSGMLLCRGVELLLGEMNLESHRIGQSVRDMATRSVSGFEINPLSAAIARINLYYTYIDAIISRGGNPSDIFLHKVPVSDLPVFNTDSYKLVEPVSEDLSRHAELEGEDIEAWKREAAFLQRTKLRADFMLVIANPPYCGQDEAVAKGRADHLKVWANEKAKRASNGGVREALLHFMGFGHRLLSRSGRGMMALVTSDTWLNNHDHEKPRRFFLRHYEPRGVVFLGPNMFPDVKVSTALVLLELREKPRSDETIESLGVPVCTLDFESTPEARHEILTKYVSGEDVLKWQTVKPDKFACIRPEPRFQHRLGTCQLSALFIETIPACQTGADPFLTSADEKVLRQRMKLILGGDLNVDPEEAIDGKNTSKKLIALRKKRDAEKIKYRSDAVRRYAKFNGSEDTFAVPLSRSHFVYFEPALLDRHRMKKAWNPHEEKLRLAFNLFETPLRCFVLENGEYLHRWQHMRFAPLLKPKNHKVQGSPSITNLTPLGLQLRERFESDSQFLFFISGIINSQLIQDEFGETAASHEPEVPLGTELSGSKLALARDVARITQSLASLERLADQWRGKVDTELSSDVKNLLTELKSPTMAKDTGGRNAAEQCFEQLKRSLDSAVAKLCGSSHKRAA